MRKLISFLGAGQLDENREYKTAQYVSPNHNPEPHTSPFVLDAILQLIPEDYDTVYILGTKTSMWETLYYWLSENRHIPENEDQLDKVIKATNVTDLENEAEMNEGIEATNAAGIEENNPILRTIEQGLEDRWENVATVKCLIIPHGETTNHFYEIFEKLTTQVDHGDQVALDVTHGYRHLAMQAFFAIRYFRVIKQIEITHIFYGALDMRGQFQGKAPILDLQEYFTSMFDGIDASALFLQTGDGSQLSDLIPEGNSHQVAELKKRLKSSSLFLQYSQFQDINSQLKNLVQTFHGVDAGDLPDTVTIMKPEIENRLGKFNKGQSLEEALILVAQNYYQNGQKAQAVLAGFDAGFQAMARKMGYNIDDIQRSDSQEIKRMIGRLKSGHFTDSRIQHFGEILLKLTDWRDNIAHAHLHLPPINVDNQLPGILEELKKYINDPEFMKSLEDIVG